MNKIKIKKIIIGALILLSLFFYGISVRASDKPKILIYHSHTCEKNTNASIVEIGNDLSRKLENKGFTVEHITTDFSKNDYNNSYYNSRADLQKLDLNTYELLLDIHTDSFNKPLSTEINGVDVAKLMFVTVSQNPNLKQQKEIISGITDNLNKFSDEIVRDETTHYKRGISYYNSDLSDNMLLIEVGDDKNTYVETKRANTYLSSAIKTYIQNKNNK